MKREIVTVWLLITLFILGCSQAGRLRFQKFFRRGRQLDEAKYFRKYLPYEEIQIFLKGLKQRYPNKIKSRLAGVSTQGRKIKLYTISSNSSYCFRRKPNRQANPAGHTRGSEDVRTHLVSANKTHNLIHLKLGDLVKRGRKPVIFIDGGAHSREWVSPAAVLYLMSKLAESDDLTRSVEWKIIPMVNPDGYIYSWNKDRFWRKTLSATPNSTCLGTDINRNFDIKWGEVDTSNDGCTENYGGRKSNSEPETLAIANSLTKSRRRTEAYISVHNWGQDILYPYSYSKEPRPDNEEELHRMGQGMADAIRKEQAVTYLTGRSSVLLYPASGTALDWAYDVLKIPLSYLFELRDNGEQGFKLGEEFIKDTGKDLYLAMEFLAKEIEKKYEKSC